MSEVLELDFQHDAIRCVPGHLPKNHLSDVILEQFTGLLDKNGKEIYENDKVVWDGGEYTVIFSIDEGAWILKDDRPDFDCPSLYGIRSQLQSRLEVISNVHEG